MEDRKCLPLDEIKLVAVEILVDFGGVFGGDTGEEFGEAAQAEPDVDDFLA